MIGDKKRLLTLLGVALRNYAVSHYGLHKVEANPNFPAQITIQSGTQAA